MIPYSDADYDDGEQRSYPVVLLLLLPCVMYCIDPGRMLDVAYEWSFPLNVYF